MIGGFYLVRPKSWTPLHVLPPHRLALQSFLVPSACLLTLFHDCASLPTPFRLLRCLSLACITHSDDFQTMLSLAELSISCHFFLFRVGYLCLVYHVLSDHVFLLSVQLAIMFLGIPMAFRSFRSFLYKRQTPVVDSSSERIHQSTVSITILVFLNLSFKFDSLRS